VALATGACGASWPAPLAVAGRTNGPRPCPPDAWKKGPVVLGKEGGPGDHWVQNFTCPAEPLDEGRWRLWYSLAGPKVPFNVAVAEGVPGEPMERRVAVLSAGEPVDAPLAIGNLPEGWRPVQPVHVALPEGRHRLYFWAHGPGVIRYLAAESDDGRRYRVLDPHRPCLYHPSDRAVAGEAAAEAGLTRFARKSSSLPQGEPAAAARLISNDATNVYRLPDGRYEMYSVGLIDVPEGDPRSIAHDNAPGLIRVIDRRTSEDGLHWSDRQRVLVPDGDDPIDQQFYYLAVTHTERGRVGMLGHYRVGAQTMDLEWCFSKDGIAWERPLRAPWIRRGRPGEPDSYGIYAPHSLVEHGGRWWLFYTGVNSSHNGKDSHGEPGSVVRLARCDSIWA
jgi:hypothetical protein